MASLIKKVWVSVANRLGPTSASGCVSSPLVISDYDHFLQMMYIHNSCTGDFDRIPIDIFMQILKILGPRESARLRLVCKSWKFLVSDNRLWIYFLQNGQEPWDSIFFAETHLRVGYPLQMFPTQMHDVSFMHIYGQRMEVPGAIIIDGALGIVNMDGASIPLHLGGQQHFWNLGTLKLQCLRDLGISFQQFATVCRMRVKASTQPVVVSIPLTHYDDNENAKRSRRQLKDTVYSTLFDMGVPAVCAIKQATLALFSARRTSGIVVNIGFHQTSVVPILKGKVMHKVGVEVVGMGAMKLTSFLRDRMQQNDIHFDSLYTVRTLKENLCYVALDYEAELSKDTRASFAVTSDNWFTLSKERFQTGEILFRPRMAGVQAMSLHQAVGFCMDHCHDSDIAGDNIWYKTVVLAGGTACLPGLAARLERELQELQPPPISNGIRVIPPPYGTDSAWYGAKLVSNMSTFPSSWCMTRKQFRHWSKRNKLLWRSS